MLDWLLLSIDPARPHLVDQSIAWHGRLMVMAWGVLLPTGVIVARYLKITPDQDWPHVLDNKFWWWTHLTTQYLGGAMMLLGLGLILSRTGIRAPTSPHALFGYSVLCLGLMQFLSGWLRGTKGGPTCTTMAGDHYDMTVRRRVFEYAHKISGYVALLTGLLAMLTGLWLANAPRWMWIILCVWFVLLLAVAVLLQSRGRAIDTYQAIWGPDSQHPGNSRKPIGWGIRRLAPPSEATRND